MLFLKFPKHLIKSQKTEEIRFTECVSKLPKHCLFYGFMQNLFIEGRKIFPKQFLSSCSRFLLKTVAKCNPEISETLFIKVNFSRFPSKTVK